MKAVLYVEDCLQNGGIFTLDDAWINRDNSSYVWWLLKQEFKKQGIDLVTQDQVAIGEAVAFILSNNREFDYEFPKKYLIILESELISPQLWYNTPKHKQYSKIFSWYPLWKDPRYVQIGWPNKIEPMIRCPRPRFACMMSNRDKTSPHYKELYSERIKVARVFGSELICYGTGWEAGPVGSKLVMDEFTFAIVFENARDIHGYVTEKIFDAMMHGCIPVYLGAPDIATYVPSGTFIQAKYGDYHGLLKQLKSMNQAQKKYYTDNIEAFLKGRVFSTAERFVKTIVDTVMADIQL